MFSHRATFLIHSVCAGLIALLTGCESTTLDLDRLGLANQPPDPLIEHPPLDAVPEQDISFAGSKRSYAWIMQTGGFVVGEPYLRKDGTWFMPMRADLSGAHSQAYLPQRTKRDVAVKAVKSTVEGEFEDEIHLWVETTRRSDEHPSPILRGANLGRLDPADYTIYYRDPDDELHRLGSLRVRESDLPEPEDENGEAQSEGKKPTDAQESENSEKQRSAPDDTPESSDTETQDSEETEETEQESIVPPDYPPEPKRRFIGT